MYLLPLFRWIVSSCFVGFFPHPGTSTLWLRHLPPTLCCCCLSVFMVSRQRAVLGSNAVQFISIFFFWPKRYFSTLGHEDTLLLSRSLLFTFLSQLSVCLELVACEPILSRQYQPRGKGRGRFRQRHRHAQTGLAC